MAIINFLKQTYDEGADALKNYFEIMFEGLPPLARTSNSYLGKRQDDPVIRAKSFSVPEYSVKTTDISFYTGRIRVPTAKIENTPEFTITFRIDRNWEMYDSLYRWRQTVFDIETGYIKFDSPNMLWLLGNRVLGGKISLVGRCSAILVTAFAAGKVYKDNRQFEKKSQDPNKREFETNKVNVMTNAEPIQRWRFNAAYPTKITGLEFDYSSGDPIEVAVTFAYLEMVEYRGDDDMGWGMKF